jgi:hypothetical protein
LLVSVLAVEGCSPQSEKAGALPGTSCLDRFRAEKVEALFSRSLTPVEEQFDGVRIVYEVVAPDRSQKSFEHLLARLGSADDLTVSREGAEWRIRVASDTVHLTDKALADALREACTTAAQNDARLVQWAYELPPMPLDDGLMRLPPTN